MRKTRTVQPSIFENYSDHEIGKELKAISNFLDKHPKFIDWVELDLHKKDVFDTGRQGLTSETVLRCGLLKHLRQVSYKNLAFYLSDSASCIAFARLPNGPNPSKSALQHTVAQIKSTTWERIHRCILGHAKKEKIELAKTIRIDSTVCDSDVHEPTDSSLLWDCVRVMVRLILEAVKLPGVTGIKYRNHTRLAKRRAYKIFNTKGMDEDKVDLYHDLLKATSATLNYFNQAYDEVCNSCTDEKKKARWMSKYEQFKPLIQKVIDQTQRRVFLDEKVSAEEKTFSIFEDHTDIIIKGDRKIQYGHKLNLTSGKSGLILDIAIEEGNPTDFDRLLPMLDRHIDIYGVAPRQVAADGGYANDANLEGAKALGVEDMAFNKKRGLNIEDMVKSSWVYRKLTNFRAGIEGNISCLKRAYGMGRCSWKGLEHFKSYIWSSVVSYNLTLMARLKPD